VLHGREDDRPGVDQGAVEIEEDDGEAHQPIVATEARLPRLDIVGS
jgi:hypothetical protein